MRLELYFMVLSVFGLSSTVGVAADYYVSKNGNDSNLGTISSPWRTIAKANTTVRPGDTVFIRGGEYSEAINPGASGTRNAVIRYQAQPGETVVVTSPPTDVEGKKTAIRLDGRDYIVIDGLRFDGKRLSGGGKDSEIDSFIRFNDAHYNEIMNCVFQYANGYVGVHVHGGSSYNRITNNSFDAVGTNHIPDGYPNAGTDRGDILVIKNASHNVIENNQFSRGGHNTIEIIGSYNIVRSNIFDGAWFGTNSPGSRAGGDLSGNAKYSVPEPRGFNLYEFNIVKNARASADDPRNVGMKVQGYNNILRANYFHDNVAEAIGGATRAGSIERNQYNRIYNNTFYNNKSLFTYRDYGYNLPFNDNVWKNNLVTNTGKDVQVVINFSSLATTNGDITDEIENTTIAGNIFEPVPGGNVKIMVKVDGNFISGDLKTMGNRYPNNIYSNRTAAIAFQNAAARSRSGFDVSSGSPAIDSGIALTTTVSAGSGSVLRVQDARYFYDGFGIPGEKGDMIMVGNSPAVRLTSIDYGRNEITLSSSISWSAQAPVNLAYSGAAPDVGAHELYAEYEGTSSSTKPLPPVILSSSN